MMEGAANPVQRDDRLLILLPDVWADSPAEAHWWHIRGPQVVASGPSAEWSALAADPALKVIGLAPTAPVRISFPDVPADATVRQRLTLARLAAFNESIAERDTLHVAAATFTSGDGGDDVVAALVANDVMLGWLEWAETHGLRLDHIVPAAMVLSLGETWTSATVGNDRFVGRRGAILPDEPGITDSLVDGPVEALSLPEIEAALLRVARDPRPDLRSGRFARRRLLVDRSQWRLLAALAAAIFLVTILTSLIEIIKLERATARLDSETLEIAQRVGGAGVTLDNSEAAVASRSGGSLSPTFARLLSGLSSQPGVTVATLGSNASTVTVSLMASSPQAKDAVIQSLQRSGYRVTAAPRAAPDGRPMVELTIQGGQ